MTILRNRATIAEYGPQAVQSYPYHSSTRKSLTQPPKFYFFDPGVQRALAGSLHAGLAERTSAFGEAFESFVILELHRRASYCRSYHKLEYFSDGKHEIDLILSRGGEPPIAVEIKSTTSLMEEDIEKLARLADTLGPVRKFLVSRDEVERTHFGVSCLHWTSALTTFFA